VNNEIRLPITMDAAGYRRFIECKRLASYRVVGSEVITDAASYSAVFGGDLELASVAAKAPHLMEFQRVLVERALSRRRFALFADCGLGKTPMGCAWATAVAESGKVLILCPLAVFSQWKAEMMRFHGVTLTDLRAGENWTDGIAILNYEARRDIDMTGVQGILLDESSILKNAEGETRDWLVGLSQSVPYRLCASATPAPNDHAEYASHAVFLGYARTAKEYYSQYFRKDGTDWVLRGHAIEPFYRNLSNWATYIYSPRALGFKDSTEMPCEPLYDYRRFAVHDGYHAKSGNLFGSAGNAEDRSAVFGEIRSSAGARLTAIADYVNEHPQCIVWCNRNAEEEAIENALWDDGVAVLNGSMPIEERVEKVAAFRAGQLRCVISKPKVLGFGVNIPECNHMVYSGFNYSFEEMYQAVRRAHRYGRVGRLEVMVPYTDPESAVLTELRAKMDRFAGDVAEMQRRFWS
jgi:superfamily II DNA or RNA helicase